MISGLLRYVIGCDQVEVNSDLLGAARALCGHESGIACILGTGSNSCYYNGKNIEQHVSPLGFILGMKTALKVHIYPANEQIRVDAGVGIFGQQAVPTLISMFLFWPVLITQISGMIAQAKMDDKVMMIAADTIAREAYRNTNNNTAAPAGGKFCTQCGKSMPAEALFCSGCGAKL